MLTGGILRGLRGVLGLALCVAIGSGLVVLARGPLLERFQRPTTQEQVSLLLSPRYSVAFSLGHRDALADYLFGTLLVRYGQSFRNKQPDPATYRYLDTITTLVPHFPAPYLYADALLTLLPTPPGLDNYLAVRSLHERGMAALPYHQELWMVAGQFATYIAPQRIPEPHASELRHKGMADLARACEMVSKNVNLPHGCIAVVSRMNKEGQRDAMIQMLSRTLAVNDDPEIRERVLAYLQRDASERERERFVGRMQELEAIWKAQVPQVSRAMMSLLGPGPSVWDCAGRNASGSRGCETTWREWAQTRSASDG